jgi:adenosylmethionine-8-amino-7-oxononanoate aminotransferase
MIVWPEGYLSRVAEAVQGLEIPLILDEVATGFGRTGAFFACQLENVTPDFLCVGKGLTGGYLPLAATLFSDRTYQRLREDPGIIYHGHSYTANPLAVAAARATVRILAAGEYIPAIEQKRNVLSRMERQLKELPHVDNIRSIGLVFAFDIFPEPDRKIPAERNLMTAIEKQAQSMGLIIRPLRNTLYLIPPLSVTDNELSDMCDILLTSVRDTFQKG